MESWHSAMSYRIFLLEREVGYQITPEMSAFVVMERLKMLDRYWKEQKDNYDKQSSQTKTPKGGGKTTFK